MRVIKKGMDSNKEAYPNFLQIAAEAVWRSTDPPTVADPPAAPRAHPGPEGAQRPAWRGASRCASASRGCSTSTRSTRCSRPTSRASGSRRRTSSTRTSPREELYKAGAKRGAIDPCFPSKVGIPHVHDLLHRVHAKKPLDVIFFPMVDALPSPLAKTQGCRACPTVTATPEAVKAAFTKESDLFAEMGVRYLNTFVNIDQPRLLEKQMWDDWKDVLGLTREEHRRAVDAGYAALEGFERDLRAARPRDARGARARGPPRRRRARPARTTTTRASATRSSTSSRRSATRRSRRTACPSTTTSSGASSARTSRPGASPSRWTSPTSGRTRTPRTRAARCGRPSTPPATRTSSRSSCRRSSAGTTPRSTRPSRRSSQTSGTPYFCFKDIDENKPTGSIKIRVETIGYFLERYREDMVRSHAKERELQERLAEFERRLRSEAAGQEEVTVGVGG